MLAGKLFIRACCHTILGLVVASCAAVAAPTPTPKPTAAPPKAETLAAKPPAAPAAPAPYHNNVMQDVWLAQ